MFFTLIHSISEIQQIYFSGIRMLNLPNRHFRTNAFASLVMAQDSLAGLFRSIAWVRRMVALLRDDAAFE
jgi:hypothetical protein